MKNKYPFLLTKIIATLGPATESLEILTSLIYAGVRSFRFNFSYGSLDTYESLLTRLRQASIDTDTPVAVLGDLAGPKIRIGQVVDGGVTLHPDQTILFQSDPIVTSPPTGLTDMVIFSTNYPNLVDEVQSGQRILLDDGFVRLECIDQHEHHLICRVMEGGTITSHKGMNLPDTGLSLPALTDKDYECIDFAVDQGFDYLALSFVRSGEDVRQLKQALANLGARPQDDLNDPHSPLQFSAMEIESNNILPVISKIEKPQAVENLESILCESDAVMVARGDLGVEMDLAEVAVLQKQIIRRCQDVGLPVIVATQMLQSMIVSPTPTRAEVSDVANAVFDGVDAVMLSGETAIGRYPLEVVQVMQRITEKANTYIYQHTPLNIRTQKALQQKREVAALAHSVQTLVQDLDIRLLVVWSQYGGGTVYLSQQRIPRPILACSASDQVLQRLALLYGLMPLRIEQPSDTRAFLAQIDRLLTQSSLAQPGEPIVIVFSEPASKQGIANQVRIHHVGETLDIGNW